METQELYFLEREAGDGLWYIDFREGTFKDESQASQYATRIYVDGTIWRIAVFKRAATFS